MRRKEKGCRKEVGDIGRGGGPGGVVGQGGGHRLLALPPWSPLSQYLSTSLPLLGSKTSVRSPFSCPRLALLVFLITRNYRQTELSKNNKHRQTPSHPESQKGLEVVSSGFDRNENVAGPAPPWAPSEHLSQEACPARHTADTVPGS